MNTYFFNKIIFQKSKRGINKNIQNSDYFWVEDWVKE